jgi:branched-chain amino acid transport system substrate-binding protein
MHGYPTLRRLAGAAAALAMALFALSSAPPAQAQSGEPIKIGFAMALTGPLAANGKQALLGMQIWEEQINKGGGLLGRPVKLVYYDDQSNPSTVPGLYTKLIDVDKVDLVVGPYATNMIAPAMPVIIQKGKVFIGLFGLAVNSEFNYPKYFAMIPRASSRSRRRTNTPMSRWSPPTRSSPTMPARARGRTSRSTI